MSKNYTTNITALKATTVDARALNAKRITLEGKDILDYIGENKTTVKHANDTRETVTENDLWGDWIETLEDGTVIVHDDWVTNPNRWGSWNNQINKVEDNKAYVDDTLYGNIQTEKIKDGSSMFYQCSALTTFTSDLSSLSDSYGMFFDCSNLTTFNCNDLSSLISSSYMFERCSNLTSITSDLSSLTYAHQMFGDCSNLTTFNCNDLSSLTDGKGMFSDCSNLTTFNCNDLSSLMYGARMFNKTKLTPQSVMYIADSIKDITAEKKLYQDGIIPYVTKSGGEYSATKGFMSDGSYVYTYKKPQSFTTTISASYMGRLTIGINVTNDANTIQDQLQAFAEEATFDSWADLKQAFVDKGWTVTWQYGGTTTNITYDMRGDRAIPCPIYAQLEEVEDKDKAEYTNEDGTKFYNISWGHDVTNYDDFQRFDSLEDAMVAYGVILNVSETEE